MVGRPLPPRRRTLVTGLVLSLVTFITAAPTRTLAQQALDPPDIGCRVYFSDGLIITEYVFRSKALAGRHPGAWPVTSMTIGTVTYDQRQLLQILYRPTRVNGLAILAKQLITAKLNIANGASGATGAQTIVNADAMIGNQVVPPCGNGFMSPSSTEGICGTLVSYNEGNLGPRPCN